MSKVVKNSNKKEKKKVPGTSMKMLGATTLHVLGSLSGGERIQNCQNEDITLDITYSCTRIQEKIMVVFELKPIEPRRSALLPPGTQQPRPSIRLAIVIDISHSMAEPYGPDDSISKLDKIKLFAQLLIKTMPDDDFLGIVTFGTKSKTIFPLTRMNPDARRRAMIAVDGIRLGGVTNLSAGLMDALDLFKTPFTKSWCRYFNDNVIVFTDGMANEGIIEIEPLISDLRKKVTFIKTECNYDDDYQPKIITLVTGGFHSELLFTLGQAFSSDAFYFLDEDTNLELNLMKPVVLREVSMVSSIKVKISALNGVLLDKDHMTNEYEPWEMQGLSIPDPTKASYFIHDIAADMQRHLVCYLKLPKKAKLIRDRTALTLEVEYRDRTHTQRQKEISVELNEIPNDEKHTAEKDILIGAEHECRLCAQQSLNMACEFMKGLNRASAREAIRTGGGYIQDYIQHISGLVPEQQHEWLLHHTDPVIANMQLCDRFLGDLSVRWDDAWARLKAMSSSLGREVPTASGVFMEGCEMFVPPKVDDKIDDLIDKLREIYLLLGISTLTIDNYKTVMKELAEKLEKLESSGVDVVKESRI